MIKEYCNLKKQQLKEQINNFLLKPILAVIQVGNNEASNRYIKNKKKDCEEVGIKCEWYHYPEEITTDELLLEIKDLQKFVNGLIVQMPLPPHIDEKIVKLAIDPDKDVDGFHPMSKFEPCTPKGIIDYLEYCRFPFEGSNALVIGRSDIVGKPMAKMLLDRDCTVTQAHSKTKDLWRHIEMADLIICAVGKAKFLNCYSIHCPVVDVGINFDENGKLVGDCFNTEDREVTPVPGGVGLLTRVALLENVVKAYIPCKAADGQCDMFCKCFNTNNCI